MEGASTSVFTGLKLGRQKRRGYKRINHVTGETRKNRDRKSRFWRMPRIKLRLKLRFSPKKFLLRLRDSYVNMMLRIANSPGVGGFAGDGVAGFGPRPLKEYDERMLVQIYKSLLIAQSQLLPRDAATLATSQNCPPTVTIPKTQKS